MSIVAPAILYILAEWLNSNLTRTYPLTEFGALLNSIPNAILIDASWYVPALLGSGYIYVSKFQVLPLHVSLYFGLWAGDTAYNDLWVISVPKTISLATTDTLLLAHTLGVGATQNLYTLALREDISWITLITGQVTIGTTIDLPWLSTVQVYTASSDVLAPTRIHPHCIHKTDIHGVSAIVVDGRRLTGDVIILAGPGIALHVDSDTNTININVDIDSIPTLELAIARLRSLLGTPITAINGKYPDLAGNFTVTGLDCTRVLSYAGGITISNPCSKPCCGESTASDLNTAISILLQSKNTMNDHYVSLSAAVNSMTSRLALLIQNLEQ